MRENSESSGTNGSDSQQDLTEPACKGQMPTLRVFQGDVQNQPEHDALWLMGPLPANIQEFRGGKHCRLIQCVWTLGLL